jgi:hypothetical protein
MHRARGRIRQGRLFAIPVNDPDSSYDYPEQVRLELEQEDLAPMSGPPSFSISTATIWSACSMNTASMAAVAGRHILTLLRKLKMPLVTTLHTVLREPDANQRAVLEEIARLSDRLVVMSEQAAQLLREVYAVPAERSMSFRTACPISLSWIPITSKTSSARKASPCCSPSACCRRTRELRT